VKREEEIGAKTHIASKPLGTNIEKTGTYTTPKSTEIYNAGTTVSIAPKPITGCTKIHIAGTTPKSAGSYTKKHRAKTETHIVGAESQQAGSTKIVGARVQQPIHPRGEEPKRKSVQA
jgi:hypothetical protein